MNDKKRIAWIDVAKGICMISVVAGHLGVSGINNIVFAFHLTVFFILSGYTLKPADLDREYLNKKFKSLMIPYFITCACVLVMDVINSIVVNRQTSIEAITGVISNDVIRSFMASGTITTFGTVDVGSMIGAIWFLPALFFGTIFTQIVLKYISDKYQRFVVSLTLMILAFISAKFVWLPFSIQAGLFIIPFILLGYEFKQTDFLSRLKWKNCAICFMAFLLCLWWGTSKINFVTASMDDVIISLISGVSSSVVIIFCAMKLGGCKPLAWIGRHSLIFMCVHLFELNTLGSWFKFGLGLFSIPYNKISRFCVEIIFVTAVTAVILLLKKELHFKTAKDTANAIGERDSSIDIARGILIVLMLIGHFSVEGNLRSIIYSFHMMAFVFLSGYFFKQSDTEDIPRAIWKLVKSLLIPYTVFAILAVFVLGSKDLETVLLGISYTKNLFTGTASVGPVYFILMLFLVRVMYLFIEKYCKNEYWKAGICLIISLGGVWLGSEGYWLPWSFDCAMFSIIVYYLGYCFRKYNLLEYFKSNLITYFGLSVVWAYMIYRGSMELAVRNYGSYGMTILGVVCATILLYMVSSYINDTLPYWITNIMRLTGESTLYILIVHALFNGQIQDFVGLRFGEGYIYHMVLTIVIQVLLGITVCLVIHQVRNIFLSRREAKEIQ